MNVSTKNRTELKSYFRTNNIPTEANYASLIDGAINQKEDGVAKVSGQPLSIQADGDVAGLQPLLSFYKNFADANPTWTINQNPRTVANNPATKKPGLNIASGSGSSRLFIRQDNGNVGIGTIEPQAKLHINGTLTVAGLTNTKGLRFDNAVASHLDYDGALYRQSGQVYLTFDDNLFLRQTNGTNRAHFHGVGLNVTGTIAATNANISTSINNGFVGDIGHGSSWAGFSHKDSKSTTGYALIHNSNGSTLLNAGSGREIGFRINNSEKMKLSSTGDLSIPSNSLSFGSTTRQMINLWSTSYGIGVQDSTTYFRTGAHFAWHKGGSHSSTALNAGSGGTALMILKDSAQLGIGTSPSHPLHVKSGNNVGLFESTGNQAYLRIHHNEGIDKRIELCCRAGGRASLWVSSAGDVLNVLPAGRVGIGTTNPATDKLEVHKNWHDTNTNDWGGGLKLVGNAPTISFWETDNGNHRWMWHVSGDIMNLYRRPAGGGWQRYVVFTNNGRMGLGTHNPTRGKLEVVGGVSHNLGGYGYTNRHGASSTNWHGNVNYGIYATDRIASSEYNAFSDLRIKDVIGVSNKDQDLETLEKIEVVDYKYKDKVANGDKTHKKVIGQQVAKVFPEVVSTVKEEAVPDVMKKASMDKGKVSLSNHGLSAGDEVRIITLEGKQEYHTVKSVSDDGFELETEESTDVIFVYGRKVNDFHVVDYEAIAMLNVSATQALAAKVKALEEEVRLLKSA